MEGEDCMEDEDCMSLLQTNPDTVVRFLRMEMASFEVNHFDVWLPHRGKVAFPIGIELVRERTSFRAHALHSAARNSAGG